MYCHKEGITEIESRAMMEGAAMVELDKRELKEMLLRGLSGLEAGRLAIQDFVDSDNNRGPGLTGAQLTRIRNSLQAPEDINDYNWLMGLYTRPIVGTIQRAEVAALRARNFVLQAMATLRTWPLERKLREFIESGAAGDDPIARELAVEHSIDGHEERHRKFLEETMTVEEKAQEKAAEERWRKRFGEPETHVDGLLREAKLETAYVAACLAVLEEVSGIVRVDLTEAVRLYLDEIHTYALGPYGSLRKRSKRYQKAGYLPKEIKLPPLRVDSIKPAAISLRYIRNDFVTDLGANWWEQKA